MKKCEICELEKIGTKLKSCKDPNEQWELKVLTTKIIMEKCFDCYYWKCPYPYTPDNN